MKRRDFLTIAGVVAAMPRLAFAQQTIKVWRVAVLSSGLQDQQRQAIFDGLGDLGYIDGKNITVELFTAPSIADLPRYAAQVVATRPDVIITSTSPPPLAVKSLTSTIPVVMTLIQDPVAIGAVASYAHPGGNLTGFMQGGPQFAGSEIELIHEVMPELSHLALLGVPADPVYPVMSSQYVAAAKALNIDTMAIEASDGEDLAPLIDRAATGGAQAIQLVPAIYLASSYPTIAKLQADRRMPVFCVTSDGVSAGLLLSYGADNVTLTRQAMSYVDAIFKGAKPVDLPIQQPTTFNLVINMKTAQALGIAFPQSILLRATQVIG